jgi:hypothetical protein
MPKRGSARPNAVREPVQVYLAADDRDLLNRLVEETGLTKAEILRRGVRSYARERGDVSPMLRFIGELGSEGWPAAAAVDHDAILAEAYRAHRKKRR